MIGDYIDIHSRQDIPFVTHWQPIGKRKMHMKKKNNYVDNKKFYECIVEYHKEVKLAEEVGKERPVIPKYAGECILHIANRLAYKPCFSNYSYKEEMISDGILNAITYFMGFDPEKGQNPFAYFTQIIYNSFIRRINNEKNNRYIIYKHFQETMTQLYVDHESEDERLISHQLYDNINQFMEKFEQKEKEKKEKRKLQKQKGLQKFYED